MRYCASDGRMLLLCASAGTCECAFALSDLLVCCAESSKSGFEITISVLRRVNVEGGDVEELCCILIGLSGELLVMQYYSTRVAVQHSSSSRSSCSPVAIKGNDVTVNIPHPQNQAPATRCTALCHCARYESFACTYHSPRALYNGTSDQSRSLSAPLKSQSTLQLPQLPTWP